MAVLILYVWICLPRNPTRFFFKICIYALVPSNWETVYLLHAKYYVQILKNIKTSRNIYLKNKLHSCMFIRKSKDRTCKVKICKVIIIKMTYSVFLHYFYSCCRSKTPLTLCAPLPKVLENYFKRVKEQKQES